MMAMDNVSLDRQLTDRQRKQCRKALQIAADWIADQYYLNELEQKRMADVWIIFRKPKNKREPSVFYSDRDVMTRQKGGSCVIIYGRKTWNTYYRKRSRQYASGVKVTPFVSAILACIHELTHYIQWIQHRQFSEVETTKNEIEWIRCHRPKIYDKVTSI